MAASGLESVHVATVAFLRLRGLRPHHYTTPVQPTAPVAFEQILPVAGLLLLDGAVYETPHRFPFFCYTPRQLKALCLPPQKVEVPGGPIKPQKKTSLGLVKALN